MSEAKKVDILFEILGNGYRSGHEILFKCPSSECKHKYKKKLSINIEKDAFKCWNCSYSGTTIRRIINRYGNYSQKRAWSELDGTVDISEYDKYFLETPQVEEVIEHLYLPDGFKTLCNKETTLSSLPARNYLKERGITKEDILFWKMGYCDTGEYAGRVIIPSFNNDGKVDFFVARTYERDWKRYLNPPARRDIIFNELFVDWSEDVTLVEGVFDAIKARNAIPLLGSTLRESSRLFKEIIKQKPTLYVALDADAEKKAERLLSDLINYGAEVYKITVPDDKDVGDMTHEEFIALKGEAQLIKNSDSLLLNKIMSI